MTAAFVWVFAQPMGDPAAWMPVLYVAFGIAGMMLAAWGWHVEAEIHSLRKRMHDTESQVAGLAVLYQHREGK